MLITHPYPPSWVCIFILTNYLICRLCYAQEGWPYLWPGPVCPNVALCGLVKCLEMMRGLKMVSMPGGVDLVRFNGIRLLPLSRATREVDWYWPTVWHAPYIFFCRWSSQWVLDLCPLQLISLVTLETANKCSRIHNLKRDNFCNLSPGLNWFTGWFFFTGPTQKSSKYGIGPPQQEKMTKYTGPTQICEMLKSFGLPYLCNL